MLKVLYIHNREKFLSFDLYNGNFVTIKVSRKSFSLGFVQKSLNMFGICGKCWQEKLKIETRFCNFFVHL